MKYKGHRDRGAYLGPLYLGDRALIPKLFERGGTGNLRLCCKDQVEVILESKEKGDLIHAVKTESNFNDKMRTLHWSVLLQRDSILEESEWLYLIQKTSNRKKQETNMKELTKTLLVNTVKVIKR